MDVLTALLACSLYPADDALVRAIALSNSHANPYFVYDPTLDLTQGDPPPDPHSTTEALERAASVEAKDAVPLLGLLDVSPAWVTGFGRPRAEAFDACTNVAVGTAWLATFESECARAQHRGEPHHPARSAIQERACVLGRYADALRMPDLIMVVTLELHAQKAQAPAVFDAPIFSLGDTRLWGPDRIFTPASFLLPPTSWSSTSPVSK